jgi:hypothetical protein
MSVEFFQVNKKDGRQLKTDSLYVYYYRVNCYNGSSLLFLFTTKVVVHLI